MPEMTESQMQILTDLRQCVDEAARYILGGTDIFAVSACGWTLTYDNTTHRKGDRAI